MAETPAAPQAAPKKSSTLKKILIGIVVVIGGFLAVVAMQPAEFRVVRSTSIAAPPAAVFAQVNDFHHWDAWSPWAKIDPEMKQTFEGAPSGTGAVYTWTGNKDVGEGRMTVTESRPGELVRIRLDFIKPFEGTNTAEFTFKAEGAQTAVTWSMDGKKNFISKAICMFMDMDKMLGGQFEKGLAQMKAVVEAAPKK
jgi:uncharacterized protein YndB with AHSA1/START domain